MMELLKKCFVELIGTFFLFFTVALTALRGVDGVIPAIAIGFALMIMVYAGGHVSGGHYNPAVSLSASIRGALPWKDLLPYWIAQCAGAVLAAYAAMQISPIIVGEVSFATCGMLLCEFLFTFALCYVVLHVATSKGTEGNSFYGLAIGSTVVVGAFATAGLCFGAFNPAVALGLFTVGGAALNLILYTVLANLLGGIAAGIVFKMTDKE